VTPLFSIVFATTNHGKLAEMRALLADLPVEVLSLANVLPERPQVAETGETFEENALLKARAAADETMLVTLAEDAGLEVDALGGKPGVRSARFAGERATDAENNAALLAALDEVPDERRTARFRSVLALVDPWSDDRPLVVVEGRCEGVIARSGRGAGGFGYDPLFVVAGASRTMAELDEAEKNALSHRGKAARALRPALERLVEARLASAEAAVSR
jgi:XTP/dITP diphosphohydrolase